MSRKSFRAITLTLSLLISMISAVTSSPMANALAACEVGSTAQNNIQVNPSHSKVFYIDTGVSPRIDASYVGYRVTNTTGSTLKGYWVSLSNFSGGQVTLANSSDQYMQLPDIANNKTQTVYFLLKASASSKIAQSHDVKVWSKRPDLATATNSYGCTFSFKKVAETIKASANKPTSTTVSSIPSIGGTFTVTSIGATGTIGAGNPDVGRILWFTPAAYSSFPTRAFRLEKVQIVTGDNANWNNSTDIRAYSERLLVDPTIAPEASASGLTLPSYKTFLTTTDNLVGKRYYQNTYTFRVIASAPSTSISPLAQISSGTQIKHTAIDANGTATINASAALVTASLTKSVTSTSYSSYPTATINGNSYNEVPYSLTLSSTANSTADEIVDTPPSGAIYKTGSTTIKIGSGSATSTSDPETLTAEASLNPRPLHFVGPFVTTSSSSIVIGYTMYVPAIAGTYTNTAYAKIGDRQIVASSGVSIPGVRVTVGGDGKVSGATTITVALNPDPLTAPATSIAATTATINGSIDANDTTTAGYFEWGTSSILSTNTSVSLGAVTGSNPTNFSSNLTGLTAGTTYYYRIVAVSSGTRYEGAIYSFTAYEAPSAPTVTTTTPTNIGVTSATLNATIDPNLQSITKIEFFYSVNSDMSSATTVSVYDLNEDGSISTTLTTLAGASPTDVSWDISGLNTTTTYYYYAVITYSGGTVSGFPTKKSFKTGTTSQYISFAALADKPFTDSSFTRTPLASSLKTSDNGSTGLSVTYTSETTDICTVPSGGDTISFVAVGFCVITATQAGDATYAAAEPVTQSFQITPSAPTATTQAASSVAITSAVLNGDFTTGGGGSTSVSFTYGTDSALSTGTTTVTTANSPATADGSRTWSLSGLTAATTYYFRISASNTTGSANGNILNFTTQNLASQTITWTTITSKYYGDTATATAPATSGLNTTITSLTPSVCTVPNPSTSGATVTLLSLGNCVLRSAQGGNAAYLPATSVDETFTVSAKPITVTAAAKTKVYGASDPSLTYTHSPALLGSDTFTGSITRGAGENVGSYSILVGSLALPSNYQLIYVGETLTVTAKPLTITADNKSKNASDPTPTFTYQISGLVNSNTVSGVTFNFSSGSYSSSTTAPTANGTYTITPSAAVFSNGSSGNYSITYNTGTYTITSLASQTLTWTTIGNKTYGTSPIGTVVSSHAPLVVTVTSNTTSICTVPSSSVSGATITLLRVGICELKASQAGDGTTYGPASDVIETFTVLAAPLVITASSPTGIKVGDAVPTISASYSGFVNSENSSVLTTQPTCVTSYTTSSTAGATETTSCSGAAATNYSITYVAGSITVGAANNSNNNNSAPAPVVKQKTTINWGNPSPIVAGTPLSGTQLNAIFSVPGTCVYTPATGTVLPEGTHTLSVTCTPNDGVNFEPLTTTVTIQVKAAKKKPSIIWFNPSPINNPTPLSGTQLNARPSIPGNLEYSPASGTVLEPGSHVLTVKLKPNDPDYEELEAKVTILVRTKPVDPKNPTPSNPGNNAEPSKPEVKDPVAPTKPAKEAGPAAIPAAKNAPVLQTAGKAAEVITVIPNQEQTGIIVSAPDWSLAISSTTKFVQGNTADSSARVVIEKGNTVTTSGTGFKPFSQVDVFVYSTPTWLGAVITDAFGNFTTTLPMPKALPEGDHTFQAEGLTPDNLERTAAVPITLVPAVVTVKPGELRFEVYFGMNSVVITKAEAAKIARNVKSALSKAASNAKITVQVVGWVQPNPKPGDIRYLSTNRAKNVAALMKKLGLKGSYSLNFPGLEKDNLPSSRHASVVIKWSITKSASA
jgi:hypothetical protein